MLPPRAEDADFGNGAPVATAGGNGAGGELVPIQPEQQLTYLPATSWPVGPTRPEILTAGPDPISLLHSLKRRWLLASVVGVVAAVGMAIFGFWLWPETYEVEALLRVSRENTQVLTGTRSSGIDPKAYESTLRTQVTLIKSDLVIIRALRDPAISQLPVIRAEPDKVGFIQDEMVVDNPRESELLRISMRGEDPVQLQKIIDGVIDSYFAEYVDKEKARRDRKLTTLKDSLAEREESYKDKNNLLSGYLRAIGAGSENLQIIQTLRNNDLQELRISIREKNSELIRIQSEIADLKLNISFAENTGVPELTMQRELMNDPDYLELYTRGKELREEESSLRAAYKDPFASSKYRSVAAQLQDIDEQLEQRRYILEPMIQQAALGGDQLKEQLASKETIKEAIEVQLVDLNKEMTALKSQLTEINNSSPEIRSLEAEMGNLSNVIADLNRQVEGLELELKADPTIQKFQDATIPETSDWLRRLMLVAFAAIAGFGLAVFGVAIWEFQSRRVNSQEQITEGLGMRLVGTLPNLAARNRLLSLGRGNRATLEGTLTESIDSIRAALIHSANGSPNQVVLVTSALDQEGKTTVASQLAVSLARSGRRTLLLDADLRNPTAHKLFELSLEDGLSEALCSQVELDDVVRPTRAPGLWMVSAGRCTMESLQEMAKGGLQTIFAKLKPQFDFIVVDSAPVLTVADTLVVAQAADSVVLSVLRDVSRVPKVYEASERLESVGVHVLGAVVNGATETAHRRTYELALPGNS